MYVCSLKVATVFLRERCWSKRTIESALRANESGRERLHERSLTKLAPGSNFEWHFWSQSHEFYLYTVSEQKTLQNKQNTKRNHNLFTNKHTSHVTTAAGIEVFFIIAKNESALAVTNHLVKDRYRKPGSIQERSLTNSPLWFMSWFSDILQVI